MKFLKKYIGDFFIGRNFYYAAIACVSLFVISFFISLPEEVAIIVFAAFLLIVMTDYVLLFFNRARFGIQRILPARLSNGEPNSISWIIKNDFSFPVKVRLIDEFPEQLEMRNQDFGFSLKGNEQEKWMFHFRPVQRGEYVFGNLHLFIKSPLGLIVRRFTTKTNEVRACYPSFVNIHSYGLRSSAVIENRQGSVRLRKIGQSMEFEQIKEYVPGDDIRTINWKATARKGDLMINRYAVERAQQVYCIVDKGRLMKMPFDNMTLLDYAINATLALSSVCLQKKDKAGLITFSNQIDAMVAAGNRPLQLNSIMESLYKQKTVFPESDFELLYHTVRTKITTRSLLLLFTNFESVNGLNRQVSYLRSLARYHLVVVIFFENTEMKQLMKMPAKGVEEIYVKTIAGKFIHEKKMIARELAKYGIATILTKPGDLTVRTVNKYLELKMKSAL